MEVWVSRMETAAPVEGERSSALRSTFGGYFEQYKVILNNRKAMVDLTRVDSRDNGEANADWRLENLLFEVPLPRRMASRPVD